MTRPENELPFFFGRDGELFGIYHPAARVSTKAVLLCAPLGQDYIRCHRLYRQLASALAGEGMSVLRFDYYGCGDSAGASSEVDWQRCIKDTVTAADELRTRSGVNDVVAFGARLGGSVALAAAPTAHFADVVVWDPVTDGGAYVATLDALQDALRRDTKRFVRPRPLAEAQGQWLGFEVNPALRRQITSLHIDGVTKPSLLVDTLASPPHDWQSLVVGKENVRPIEPATPWDDLARLEAAIISHPLVQTVTAHFRGGH
ncbi:alpha/beta fold hydrolase [Dyella sp. 20L07]|uniref:alpha/beta fold hydrolase n=1 Tax=Dyella sp. 20L07 TaxID=3384240 RepID=UPI003D294B54